MNETQATQGAPQRVQVVVHNSVNESRICGGRGQLTASSTTLYTVPTSSQSGSTQPLAQKSALYYIVLCNTDTSTRTVTIYLVESGGSVADNRAILKDVTIAAKTTQTEFWEHGLTLEAGETVRGLASVANVVTYRLEVGERY